MSTAEQGTNPTVWYLAAGYRLPAGIEAYLLHYATEMRRRGFAPRIMVFERLPRVKHRYLVALEDRGIPIESLFEGVAWRARIAAAVTFLPWWVRRKVRGQRSVVSREILRSAQDDSRPHSLEVTDRGLETDAQSPVTNYQSPMNLPFSSLFDWWLKRLAVRKLQRMICRERPDIIHVKGRIVAEAWPVLPGERTVYQHALSGTVDPSWTAREVRAFGEFANRIARVLAPGAGVARTLAGEYGINRPIDAVFTMAPDEAGDGGQKTEDGCRRAGQLRFGIVCRFTAQKGIVFILEALRQYQGRHGDVRFTFAGQGELEPEIRRFAGANGLSHVEIVRVPDLRTVMDQLDVFVHPGLDDAMPVSLVEALMFGKPCVSTRVGGVPDLIRDGVEGFLIEPSSATQILDAMERFAAMSTTELAGFRTRARARYEAMCRPEVVGEVVAGIYREVMRRYSECRTPQ